MGNEPWRRDCLGSSDAPAVAGVDPFRTAGDIWAAKTGRIPASDSEENGTAASLSPLSLGSVIGPLLVGYAGRVLNRPVAGEVWYRHPTAPLACSVDGISLDEPGVLIEAKTTGIIAPVPPQYAGAYGEDGTDEVPESVTVQVHHAFAVLEAQPNMPPIRQALVPVLIGGRGVRCYRLKRDEKLVRDLVDLETAWWEEYVQKDVCPPQDPPSLATLKRFERQPDRPPVRLDPVIVAEWLQGKEVRKQAERNDDYLHRLVLALLGDGEAGECEIEGVSYRLTYKANPRVGYYVEPTTVRTLRISKK
jgi:predicted phage-related endonuclease